MSDDNNQDQAAGGDRITTNTTGSRRSIAVIGDRIDSRELFIGTRELIIDHGSEHYRLRLTAQNKLILTK